MSLPENAYQCEQCGRCFHSENDMSNDLALCVECDNARHDIEEFWMFYDQYAPDDEDSHSLIQHRYDIQHLLW